MSFDGPSLRDVPDLLGIDPRYAGAGLKFDVAAVLPQTGPGALYDERISDVPDLACRHILRMGGPRFNLIMRDNRTGHPEAGARAVAELGAAKVPMMLSTYAANFGALLPEIERHKIFTLDGGGGAPLYAQRKPYFWGSIALTPNDALAGAIAFVRRTFPYAVKYATIGWDLGTLDAEIAFDAGRAFKGSGLQFVFGTKTKVGATDYTAAISGIAQSGCEFVFCFLYGQDVGHFMKQYGASNVRKPVMAFTHSDIAQRIAGHGYDGLYFAFDYFDGERPSNPWAKFYVNEFYDASGTSVPPDNYMANAYEDLFVMWACVRRVLERGGDPHDGAQLDAALRADPSFPSLYGGNADAPGTLAFDLSTHSVVHRPMTIARIEAGTIAPLAHFESGRRELALV